MAVRMIRKFRVESFDGVNEAFEKISKRSNAFAKSRDERYMHPERRSDPGFTGVESYEQGVEFIRKGYKPALAGLKRNGVDACVSSAIKRQRVRSVSGGVVVVPEATMGIPTCFRRRDNRVKEDAVLSIVYVNDAPGFVSASRLQFVGSAVYRCVSEIQAAGQQVELFTMIATENLSATINNHVLLVKVKDAGSAFDAARTSFCLCSSAFLRWLGFHWIATQDGCHDTGLGRCVDDEVAEKIVEDFFGKQRKTIYLSFHQLNDICESDEVEFAKRVKDKINIQIAKKQI